MTKRYTLLLLALATAGATGMAAPRSLQEARALAEQQLSLMAGHNVSLDAQPQHATIRGGLTAGDQMLPYYHFTTDNDFVIIAGSDLMPAVIGYGQGKGLDADQPLPPNVQGWLDQVAEAEAYLEANPSAAMAQLSALEATSVATEPITPIMTCKWGQDQPFNDLCPVTDGVKTVVGCVATALSQILYTQRFPEQSHGQVSYKNHGKTLEADLEGVTYDYDLMRDKYYRVNTTDEENAEVAKLCYNVGVASMMQYGEMSGSIIPAAMQGLVDNFGVTKVAYIERHHHALNDWNDIIQGQLLEGNPVFFSGQSSAGGHAFVLDGLDDKGYYHVNWGWDGQFDGYFDVSLLRTNGAGTGASENGGFYLDQGILVNICDPEKVTHWYNPLNTFRSYYDTSMDNINCKPSTDIKRGTKLTLSAYTINNDYQAFEGKAGVLVMKDGEQFDLSIGEKTFTAKGSRAKLNNYSQFNWETGDCNVSATYTLPDDLADGTYRLYLVMQSNDEQHIDAVRQYHFRPSYWELTVDGDNLKMKHDKYGTPTEVASWNFDEVQLTTGPCQVVCRMHNTIDEQVSIRFYLRLTPPDGKTMSDVKAGGEYDEPITFEAGETRDVVFDFTALQAGQWKAKLYATVMGLDSENKTLIDNQSFTLEADATRGAVLSLLEAPIVENETVTNGDELTMTLRIKNEGSDYDGRMSIRLYSKSSSTADTYLKAEIENESVQIKAGETKDVTISGQLDIPSMTKNTAYYARAFYLYGDEMNILDEKKYATVRVYAATGIAEVKADDDQDLQNAEIYDVLGKRVQLPQNGQLRPGIYIINGRKRLFK